MNELIPQGFLYKKASEIEAKIIGFKNAGAHHLQLVLDFDRTLTEENNQDSTSWQLMRNHLPEEGRDEARDVFEKYRAMEVAGILTAGDATDWWTTSIAIVAKYRLDMNVVEREFLSHATIRPGTKELFELCEKHNIPTIIMSAGIKDVIDIWCKTFDIHPTIILSTKLTVDNENRVTGWEETSVVHMFNKHELDHPELTKIRSERAYTILAGDSLHDHNMAEGTDGVIRVRILDRGDTEAEHDKKRQSTFELFDVCIEDGTLYPIVRLIEEIVGKT